jgi:hypothetical protein
MSAPSLREITPERPEARVLLVRYESHEDLAPERQGLVVRTMREVGHAVPVALVFVVPPGVWKVQRETPEFWLDVTAQPECRLTAMAIVTKSLPVRMAATGFAIANTLRKGVMAVEAFADENEAIQWAISRTR